VTKNKRDNGANLDFEQKLWQAADNDETLRTIARELANTIRNNVTIDWTLRESVQAKLRVNVKRVLKKYGYPPDKQKKATETVLEQATLIAKDWAEKAG
jgi:type I restriction enzyme R subunit